MGTQPKDASAHTAAANHAGQSHFDPADFHRAERGLIAQHPTGAIDTDYGVVWDINRYAFIQRGSDNPPTVNPSLWRQAQLNGIHGLFEVADGVWQARGYDISNITFIAGATGWIVIDPLTAEPCAHACLQLANAQLGERPVVAAQERPGPARPPAQVDRCPEHDGILGDLVHPVDVLEVDVDAAAAERVGHALRDLTGRSVLRVVRDEHARHGGLP